MVTTILLLCSFVWCWYDTGKNDNPSIFEIDIPNHMNGFNIGIHLYWLYESEELILQNMIKLTLITKKICLKQIPRKIVNEIICNQQ